MIPQQPRTSYTRKGPTRRFIRPLPSAYEWLFNYSKLLIQKGQGFRNLSPNSGRRCRGRNKVAGRTRALLHSTELNHPFRMLAMHAKIQVGVQLLKPETLHPPLKALSLSILKRWFLRSSIVCTRSPAQHILAYINVIPLKLGTREPLSDIASGLEMGLSLRRSLRDILYQRHFHHFTFQEGRRELSPQLQRQQKMTSNLF